MLTLLYAELKLLIKVGTVQRNPQARTPRMSGISVAGSVDMLASSTNTIGKSATLSDAEPAEIHVVHTCNSRHPSAYSISLEQPEQTHHIRIVDNLLHK